MSDTKFTPGPWSVWRDANRITGVQYFIAQAEGAPYTPNYSDVAQTCVGEKEVVQQANANLIAAAPDMYALLSDLLKNHECGEIVDQEIQEVLAKAEGKS